MTDVQEAKKMIETMNLNKLRDKRVYMFDIDGTLATGKTLLSSSSSLLEWLLAHGKRIFYVTNNSTKSRADYVKQFAAWGIMASEEQFITAGQAAVSYCLSRFKNQAVYLVGTDSFNDELRHAGLWVIDHYEPETACVLVGYDTSLAYQKLYDACRLLKKPEVAFVATNPDLRCPTEWGAVPDCGSICQMVTNATGRVPLVLGKPETGLVDMVQALTGAERWEMLLVGDRLYTDMECAERAGVDSILVLTGETSQEEAENSPVHISYIMKDVSELLMNLQNR